MIDAISNHVDTNDRHRTRPIAAALGVGLGLVLAACSSGPTASPGTSAAPTTTTTDTTTAGMPDCPVAALASDFLQQYQQDSATSDTQALVALGVTTTRQISAENLAACAQ